MPGVLVVCDARDGKLKKTSREMLTIGRSLATAAGCDLAALAFGPDAASLAGEAGDFGAKTLHTVPSIQGYNPESCSAALRQAVEAMKPSVVLLAADANGRDLAPTAAAPLDAGVASDVIGLEWRDGKLIARRPMYSGKVVATLEVDAPAFATCRPNAFPAEPAGGAAAAVVPVAWEPKETRSRVLETRVPENEEMTIAEADIVVSGGRGLKEPANFSVIRDLASALGAAVGASRAVVDAGWIDHQHQVGQTGRVVSPNLYIAVGISGAIQHLAGMTSSKHIIAINKDPEAPIFRVADLGVVGDLFQIVPAVTAEVKKAKEH